MVSVIVPCYNAEKTIYHCLKGLVRQNYPACEVIVVDDASTDHTPYILPDFNITILRNEVNRGPAYSRNKGAEYSDGELFLFIDADCMVEDRDLVERHVQAHKRNPKCVIGGGIRGTGRGIVAQADKYSHWFLNIPHSKKGGTHLVTTNMSVEKDLFERIGAFDETLRTGEDTDFCERAVKKGYRLKLASDIVVRHQDRENLRDFLRNFYLVGLDRVPARRANKHRWYYLLPFGLVSSVVYLFPLAILLTLQVIIAWFRHDPRVLLYSPLIFAGRFAMAAGIVSYYLKEEV